MIYSHLTNNELIELYLDFENQRYALQIEIGRRNIGWQVDEAASKYFQIGKLVRRSERTVTSNHDLSQEDFDL